VMLPEQQSSLLSLIARAAQAVAPEAQPNLQLERPKLAAHGDVATNVAMQLAKPLERNPRELAHAVVEALVAQEGAADLVQKAEIAGPGFINIHLPPAAKQAVVGVVLNAGSEFGKQASQGQKLMLEFVSANPTGPLHVGHARQAA